MPAVFPAASAASAARRPVLLFAGLLVLIILIERRVTGLPAFARQPLLPVGVVVDLLLVVPALFYVLVVRPLRLSAASLGGAVGVGLALAFWLIPVAQQQPLRALRWLPGLLEALTLAVAAAKARRMVRAYRATYAQLPHYWPALRAAVAALGRVGALLLAEADLLRYALLGWWAAPDVPAAAVPFSSHRESGFPAFIAMLTVALLVETAGLHLLVGHWSPALAAWVLVFDAYAVLTCVAHGHAVRLRPSLLFAETLELRVGTMWRLVVPRAALLAVEPLRDRPAPHPDTLDLTRLLFTTPNLLLTFTEPVTLAGPYGTHRTARRVAFYLDEPAPFRQAAQQPTGNAPSG